MTVAGRAFIGIVTVLYNSDEVLPDFFASVALQDDVRFRLYVIDNGATDSGTRLSQILARERRVDTVCVFNNANGGVAKGNNQGIDLALRDGCTHVLLANNDTAFESGTVSRLLDAMTATGSDAATPKILYHGHSGLLWYAGGHINGWTMKSPHYGERTRDTGHFDEQVHVGYAPTCFMLIRRSVFDAVGRMDEQYFVYSDDTDFVWRMNRSDLRLLYVPKSVVQHKVSASTGGARTPFTVYYSNRNRIYFARKNLRGLQRIIAIAYILSTRMPRLMSLPWASAKRGWLGVIDGFRMTLPSPTDR